MTSPDTTAHKGHERARSFVILAHAKINLTLQVLGRREDGYHELQSLVAFAQNCADHLTISPSNSPTVITSGAFSHSLGDDNLVIKAMLETLKHDPRTKLADIVLQKDIPVAAGLGGGSSDAAATLRALQKLNPDIAPDINWNQIATRLGADVPACMISRASLMQGTGDHLTPIKNFPTLHAVLVNPNTKPLTEKTKRVFKKLNAATLDPRSKNNQSAKDLADAITSANGDANALTQFLVTHQNDLEKPATALMPEIEIVKAAIQNSNHCQLARLSGAGPTCFALYPSEKAAITARDTIKNDHPDWWVVATPLM